MYLHHAVVFEGEGDAVLDTAYTYVREVLGLAITQNPDVTLYRYERFGVDDVRALKLRAAQSPLGVRQAFILFCSTATREAQNALLKLLEEPAGATHFVLIVPSVQFLLETVRSRLAYGGKVSQGVPNLTFAQQFVTAPIGERLRLIEALIKEKDRTQIRVFLEALEHVFHGAVKDRAAELQEIMFVRTYVNDRSASVKMLLEHLAHVV